MKRRREHEEDRQTQHVDPRPRGNPRCVCGWTGQVAVICQHDGEFVTALGNPCPAGSEQSAVCLCAVGDWIWERLTEGMPRARFNSSMQAVKAEAAGMFEERVPLESFEQPLPDRASYAKAYQREFGQEIEGFGGVD